MPARAEDDFGAFAGHEQQLFGLRDPLGLIRSELEQALREQVPDTELLRIATLGEPKFLTLGRRVEDAAEVLVSHFGFCVRVQLTVLFDEGRKGELIEACVTCLFGDVDVKGAERFRRYIDLHAEADARFDDAVFKERLLAFRSEKTRRA